MMLDTLSFSLSVWNLYIYILDHYLRPLTTLNGNLLKFSFSFLHYLIFNGIDHFNVKFYDFGAKKG